MKNAFGAALAVLCLSHPAHAQSACPPAGYDAARLEAEFSPEAIKALIDNDGWATPR